jgi:hypothetical protein
LSPRYDQPHPVPDFCREAWGLYSDLSSPNVAIAAPRKHTKSTSLTDAFMMAALLLRWRRYVVFFSATEDLAIEHLGRTIDALKWNDDLRRDFHIRDFDSDTKTDIIVRCADGYQFRVIARGAGQRIRGRNWLSMRPDLLLGDDLESKETVSSKETRADFRRWFFREAKQLLGEGGISRVHGTILADDSLLWQLTHSKSWVGRIYRAHSSYTNFTRILWPERFSEAELRAIQQEFVDARDPAGYSCEYLNAPRDRENVYLRKEWFKPLEPNERTLFRRNAVGVDFAISQQDTANSSVFMIGGKRVGGHIDVLSRRKGRMDALELINTFFEIQLLYSPDAFVVEDGMIWKTLKPTLEAEMRDRDIYLNIIPKVASKDKAARGRPMQKRMRYGGMSFDQEGIEDYSEYESVMLLFSAEAEALEDDDFDATAWLVVGLEEMPDVSEDDYRSEAEEDFVRASNAARAETGGRSAVTGY